MEKQQIEIERTVNKDVESVWSFYNQVQHIMKWNFTNNDWCCPKASNDLRVNGKLNSRMEAKDGSFGFDFKATYNKIDELKQLIYNISDGRMINIYFEDLGNTTKVKINFEAENSNSIEMQKGGWEAILNNFKKYVESL